MSRSSSGSMVANTFEPRETNWCSLKAKTGRSVVGSSTREPAEQAWRGWPRSSPISTDRPHSSASSAASPSAPPRVRGSARTRRPSRSAMPIVDSIHRASGSAGMPRSLLDRIAGLALELDLRRPATLGIRRRLGGPLAGSHRSRPSGATRCRTGARHLGDLAALFRQGAVGGEGGRGARRTAALSPCTPRAPGDREALRRRPAGRGRCAARRGRGSGVLRPARPAGARRAGEDQLQHHVVREQDVGRVGDDLLALLVVLLAGVHART